MKKILLMGIFCTFALGCFSCGSPPPKKDKRKKERGSRRRGTPRPVPSSIFTMVK